MDLLLFMIVIPSHHNIPNKDKSDASITIFTQYCLMLK